MKFILLTLILSLFVHKSAFSQGKKVGYLPSIVTGYYQVPSDISLDQLLKDDIALNPGLPRSELEAIIAAIKKYNPAITNWKNITADEILYFEIPYKAVGPESILFQKKNVEPAVAVNDKDDIRESFVQKDQAVAYLENKSNYSMMASTSMGTFKERSPSGNNIKTKQFSPITLGFAVSVSDPSRVWSYSSSIYVSYILSQKAPVITGIQNNSISIPLEVGVTGYVQRVIIPQLISVYAGMDIEKFSTFNLVEIEEGRSTALSNREHKVLYGTLGSNLYLKIKKQEINLRASYSKSIFSDVNIDNVKSYKDYKAIFYLQLPINEKYYLNSFFKYHNMSGESELTVTRIGIGIGYLF